MKWRIKKSSSILLSFCFVFFCLVIDAENPKRESLSSLQEFFEKSPIPRESLSWSAQSANKFYFSENSQWELNLAGKLEPQNELFFNGKKVEVSETRNFKIKLILTYQKNSYDLVLKNALGSLQSYPFEIILTKEPPPPLRAKIRVAEDQYIIKGASSSSVYSSEAWLRFSWLKQKNEIAAEILQSVREQEKKEKEQAYRKRLEEERQKEEAAARALAAQLEHEAEIRYQSRSKEFWGWSFDQGVAVLSSQKSGLNRINSSNWLVNIEFRKALDEKTFLQFEGQTFAFPLSVSGARTGPRLVKLGVTGGLIREIVPKLYLLPILGGTYQSLASLEDQGYSGKLGPRLGAVLRYDLSDQQVIQSSLSLATFGSPAQYSTLAQYEIGFKLVLEWKNFSPFFQSFYLGGELSQSQFTLEAGRFSGAIYSGFLGVKF